MCGGRFPGTLYCGDAGFGVGRPGVACADAQPGGTADIAVAANSFAGFSQSRVFLTTPIAAFCQHRYVAKPLKKQLAIRCAPTGGDIFVPHGTVLPSAKSATNIITGRTWNATEQRYFSSPPCISFDNSSVEAPSKVILSTPRCCWRRGVGQPCIPMPYPKDYPGEYVAGSSSSRKIFTGPATSRFSSSSLRDVRNSCGACTAA
jgi:hypothetical protein